jgi:hypothetical protein
MRWLYPAALVAIVYITPVGVPVSHAASPVPVAMGASWDGTNNDLQHIIDVYLGAPGLVNVQTDYVGAHAGDLDPWFWVGSTIPTYLVTEIAANSNVNEVGWYRETFVKPVLTGDGLHDGVVFNGPQGAGQSALVTFPSGTQKFGFYLDTHQTFSMPSGSQEEIFFTNRFYNEPGYRGEAPTHAPYDGDVQALVFDVHEWKGDNTWLVCFEDIDSGAPITPAWACDRTDDDYNDFVFLVTAYGATPAKTTSFGALKSRYR